ncbi:uncharacterized protein LOC108143142 [Drosophila elegans]|uniref:uncharacterized protein LOC108143142 n=1 Tax=Drosophila elegans TaxID=30023 RepID=UPI0007E6CCFB|nr:uncharacterized protein LOC108143142 [Drosophila elegans]
MTWSMWLLPLAYFFAASEGSFDTCDFMLEDDHPFTLACESHYSSDLKLNYRDIWVKADAPYWLWWRRQPSLQLLASFYESPISACTNVTLSLNCLHCSNSEEHGIHIRPEAIHCFDFSFSYVRALMKHCGLSTKPEPSHVAIHYARLVPDRQIPSRAARTQPGIAELLGLWSNRW